MTTNKRRWRLWTCFEGDPNSKTEMRNCHSKMEKEIEALQKKGFKAKRWAPRPEHYWSGYFHVVVLCTFDELCKLGGIQPKYRGAKK